MKIGVIECENEGGEDKRGEIVVKWKVNKNRRRGNTAVLWKIQSLIICLLFHLYHSISMFGPINKFIDLRGYFHYC